MERFGSVGPRYAATAGRFAAADRSLSYGTRRVFLLLCAIVGI